MDLNQVSLEAVFSHIEKHADLYIYQLQELIRHPSVSAQKMGVRECASWIAQWLHALGAKADIVETDGLPIILGKLDQPGDCPTLLVYTHYDVQPAEPLEEWSYPPFDATIVDKRIIGRGATDAKGNLAAHLAAVSSIHAAVGKIPIKLLFLFDGEEEIGSPNLPAFVEEYRKALKADAVISFDGGIGRQDRPKINLGGKGLLTLELSIQSIPGDLHSAKAPLAPSAAWLLLWALASIKAPDEKILIPSFYDNVRLPSPAEEELLKNFPWEDKEELQALGIPEFLTGVTGYDALRRLLYEPSCNISGVTAGYQGLGSKTVLPARAKAKIDFRLVPDQDGMEILQLLRQHLDDLGFMDIQITATNCVEPSQAPIESDIVAAVRSAGQLVYKKAPAIKPRVEASGRQATWLGHKLGIPAVATGVGPPQWNGHAPNEFITISHFIQGIKFVAAIYFAYASSFEKK